ncbi:hypothetical protein GUITHDRAFT_115567 [Guillardia theta CCMP2712]|uniref:Uncharacterized protein n=1 Tax=Guillardia theta (strain CCMP2712) TaxID=905079 RepID=L1IQR7_GUITC|nr:hypothetical protein GUITHDRAFT_115567 [Guillardia theta CCMP2712]EKX38224.1 hypothetical protein GUITHDRAFT_115567 [Guillardia theta CCMP2712]|eukprot:XP_005825204.1 hypothetical protein GUITHDRAFT_115567 [Guillardia theta CCMP2712]
MEFAEVPEPLKSPFPVDEQTKGKWRDIPNQIKHAGYELGVLHSCSWVVTDLKHGAWVTFRVERFSSIRHLDLLNSFLSFFSQAFCVGGRNFSAHGRGVGGDAWTLEEEAFFQSLNTPEKVQDYLDSIPMNHEVDKDVSLSALECVRQNHAHCLEGALLGAYILSLHGFPAQLLDLRASKWDDDHVVTPFQRNGLWGCLSVSNHSSLRFRNSVYNSIRELVMSYFDDYMNGEGKRTLRCYSKPMDLKQFGDDWLYQRGDEGSRGIAYAIDQVPHYRIFRDSKNKSTLRPADEFMLKTTVDQREWHHPSNADEEAHERNKNR